MGGSSSWGRRRRRGKRKWKEWRRRRKHTLFNTSLWHYLYEVNGIDLRSTILSSPNYLSLHPTVKTVNISVTLKFPQSFFDSPSDFLPPRLPAAQAGIHLVTSCHREATWNLLGISTHKHVQNAPWCRSWMNFFTQYDSMIHLWCGVSC